MIVIIAPLCLCYEYEDVSPRVYPISLTATFTPDPSYIVYSAAMPKLNVY